MFIYFVTIGLVYGITTGKITRSRDVPQRMAESASDLAPTLAACRSFRCTVRY
jgi:aminobenzoyl-glutamate transport protein